MAARRPLARSIAAHAVLITYTLIALFPVFVIVINSFKSRRAIFAEMLGRHAKPDSVRQEVAVPGWTQDLVDEITDAYEEDVALIAALPGVEFLSP